MISSRKRLRDTLKRNGLDHANTIPIVVRWLTDLAKQADEDGSSAASEVFVKAAERLGDNMI